MTDIPTPETDTWNNSQFKDKTEALDAAEELMESLERRLAESNAACAAMRRALETTWDELRMFGDNPDEPDTTREIVTTALQPTAGAELMSRLQAERELADMLALALTHYEGMSTLSDPDWWDYHGQGGAPERCDLIETDIGEPARDALAEWREARK